eukprot:1194292-Prorocentrum_minimum.AAC.2
MFSCKAHLWLSTIQLAAVIPLRLHTRLICGSFTPPTRGSISAFPSTGYPRIKTTSSATSSVHGQRNEEIPAAHGLPPRSGGHGGRDNAKGRWDFPTFDIEC